MHSRAIGASRATRRSDRARWQAFCDSRSRRDDAMTESRTDVDAPTAMRPSRLQLAPGPWTTLIDGLCARFPAIARERWLDRFERGRVLDADGIELAPDMPYRVGLEVRYFREVPDEVAIPFQESVLHVDPHLVVADKPHFLPVTPGGGYVRETLLARLIARLDNPDLVPLHRIDRATAGLVLFSANPRSRADYQSLFAQRRIVKHYEAVALALPSGCFRCNTARV
jgi:tRNA pseudouridine32 synthase/23S rRNA pseudouridine746 synthase